MKFVGLTLVSLLVLSSVNAQSSSGSTSSPSFVSSASAYQNYSSCLSTAQAATPCTSSSNQSACATAKSNYDQQVVQCITKTSYSDFVSCVSSQGTTATTADSTLTSYVGTVSACNSKLSGSLLSLSALVLMFLALVF
ncbi:hypothetical protein ABPG74_011299 [Tetrahymena malaccensis]